MHARRKMGLAGGVGLGLQTCLGFAFPTPALCTLSPHPPGRGGHKEKGPRWWHGTDWLGPEFHARSCFCLPSQATGRARAHSQSPACPRSLNPSVFRRYLCHSLVRGRSRGPLLLLDTRHSGGCSLAKT